MLFESVREFMLLCQGTGVKASNPRFKELLLILRRAGLTSPQIVKLSGGYLSDSLVRQYTRGWGGLDKTLSRELDALMAPLRELVSSGKGVGDIDIVLKLDKSVRAKSSSIEEVGELNSCLKDFNVQPGEVGEVVELLRNLKDDTIGLSPAEVKNWLTLDKKLSDEGFKRDSRALLLQTSQKYGGIFNVIMAIKEYDCLETFHSEKMRIEAKVKQLNSDTDILLNEKSRLELIINNNYQLINQANLVKLLGFEIGSLSIIKVLCEKYGGPYKVINAIEKYLQIIDIDESHEKEKVELAKTKLETSQKRQMLNALNYAIEEAKQVYEKNNEVRMVVELLANPRGIRQERVETALILHRVLECGAQRMEENPDYGATASFWNVDINSIKILAKRLELVSNAK